MAPSLRKGKARAEAHKGRVITSKRKSRTRTRLSQQEVINKYLEDHPDFWDKEESARDKIINDLENAQRRADVLQAYDNVLRRT